MCGRMGVPLGPEDIYKKKKKKKKDRATQFLIQKVAIIDNIRTWIGNAREIIYLS